MFDDMEMIPISSIEHLAYCERQCALILVDGIWVDNEHTVQGQRAHQRADTEFARRERGRIVARAVPLYSERLGLTGRADAVELNPDGSITPVEYKAARRHGRAADLQLCAQALCLEEMFGTPVPQGALWLSKARRRITVEIDTQLRLATELAIRRIREILDGGVLPPPVADSRCNDCQLVAHCLPYTVKSPRRVLEYMEYVVWSSS